MQIKEEGPLCKEAIRVKITSLIQKRNVFKMDEIPPEHKLTFGVDVLDTFAPVIDCSAVRLLISTAFGFGWAVYHWDFYVTNADSHEPTCQTSKEFVM